MICPLSEKRPDLVSERFRPAPVTVAPRLRAADWRTRLELDKCQPLIRWSDNGDGVVEVLPDQDLEPGAGATAPLSLYLQDAASDDHRVIRCNSAPVFLTEDRSEIDAPERHERGRAVAWRTAKRGIVLRQIDVV